MISSKNIVIVDYGVGNLWSLGNAVRLFAPNTQVTEEREKIEQANAIILPGVGAFNAGMEGLRVRGLIEPITEAAKQGVPILGICLGAQLLLEKSNEFGEHAGLGLIKGETVHFPELPKGIKVPAIGWQEVTPGASGEAQKLFAGVGSGTFYFVHSYILKPAHESSVLAKTVYGGFEYAAAIGEGRIAGTQFHPEKSGAAGLSLLQNFISSV